MSERQIQHVIPDDGTQHEPIECYCHPDICEANAWGALAGLEDVGVASDEAGTIIFTHNKASDTSKWTICIETDGDEE